MRLRNPLCVFALFVLFAAIDQSSVLYGQGLLRRIGDQMRARRANIYGNPPQQIPQQRIQQQQFPQQRVPQYRVSPLNQQQTRIQRRVIDPRIVLGQPQVQQQVYAPQTSQTIQQQAFNQPKIRPTLGVIAKPATESEAVEVVEFKEHSKADEAGLKIGDQILTIDGRPTPDVQALIAYLAALPSRASEVTLRIRREGRVGDLVVPVVEHPKAQASALAAQANPRAASAKPEMGIEVDSPAGIRGAVVREIAPDSPAYKSGLRVGDRIVSVDGRIVQDSGGLASEVGSKRPGDVIAVQLVRGNMLYASRIQLAAKVEATDDTKTEMDEKTRKELEEESGSSILDVASNPLTKRSASSANEVGLQGPKNSRSSKTSEPVMPSADIDPFELGADAPIEEAVFGPRG